MLLFAFLFQLLGHPRLCRDNDGQAEIRSIMGHLTNDWERAQGQVCIRFFCVWRCRHPSVRHKQGVLCCCPPPTPQEGATGCCFVTKVSFQMAVAVPPPSIDGPVAYAMRQKSQQQEDEREVLFWSQLSVGEHLAWFLHIFPFRVIRLVDEVLSSVHNPVLPQVLSHRHFLNAASTALPLFQLLAFRPQI